MYACESRDTQPDAQHHLVKLLGTGASAPTKELGHGITVTRVAAGRYLLTWTDAPGVFGFFAGWGLQSTTLGDVKGHTVTVGDYNSTAKTIEVQLWNSTFAADDLQATERMHLDLCFLATGATAG